MKPIFFLIVGLVLGISGSALADFHQKPRVITQQWIMHDCTVDALALQLSNTPALRSK